MKSKKMSMIAFVAIFGIALLCIQPVSADNHIITAGIGYVWDRPYSTTTAVEFYWNDGAHIQINTGDTLTVRYQVIFDDSRSQTGTSYPTFLLRDYWRELARKDNPPDYAASDESYDTYIQGTIEGFTTPGTYSISPTLLAAYHGDRDSQTYDDITLYIDVV